MSCSGKGSRVFGVPGPVEQVQQGVQGGQVHDRGRGQEGNQGHRAGGGRDRSQTEEVVRLQLSSVFVIVSARLVKLFGDIRRAFCQAKQIFIPNPHSACNTL